MSTILKPTADELAAILADHKKWKVGDSTGKRADLSRADLSGATLSGSDLYGADLSGSDLSGANLSGANLYGAPLYGANLYGANLSGANLSGATLSGATLSRANLSGANLSEATLSMADLSGSDLSGANLYGANLYGADLSGSNLSGSNLSGSNLKTVLNAALVMARTEILPREGEVTGWKRCLHGVLVKLKVPADAKRSNASGRKCRAERVEVLETIGADRGVSMYDLRTEYRAGSVVAADGWGADRWSECDKGIHFFLTREEAEAY